MTITFRSAQSIRNVVCAAALLAHAACSSDSVPGGEADRAASDDVNVGADAGALVKGVCPGSWEYPAPCYESAGYAQKQVPASDPSAPQTQWTVTDTKTVEFAQRVDLKDATYRKRAHNPGWVPVMIGDPMFVVTPPGKPRWRWKHVELTPLPINKLTNFDKWEAHGQEVAAALCNDVGSMQLDAYKYSSGYERTDPRLNAMTVAVAHASVAFPNGVQALHPIRTITCTITISGVPVWAEVPVSKSEMDPYALVGDTTKPVFRIVPALQCTAVRLLKSPLGLSREGLDAHIVASLEGTTLVNSGDYFDAASGFKYAPPVCLAP